jgi:hypothetical protein
MHLLWLAVVLAGWFPPVLWMSACFVGFHLF